MYLQILIMPMTGALLSTIWGRKLGLKGSSLLCTMILILMNILVITIFYEVAILQSPVLIVLDQFLGSLYLDIEWSFLFDSLTVSLLIPVVFISTQVHIFSLGYMEYDPHKQRFFAYLSQFTFFMIVLITGENLLLLFIGWEGVGLSSYLLINFWFTRLEANKAALKAFLMNRIGDWGIILGIYLIIGLIGDLSLSTIFLLGSYLNYNIIFIITILLLIGCIAKSAQLGLHTWLPSAMEGPTPVSALIHAATMVTAGVYLLLRFSPLLEWCNESLLLISWIGAITAQYGGASGQVEYDIKKVIAYSTTSQLGYMVQATGLSQYSLSLFHLINHAFFKALLFLSAGAIIHALYDEQDFRKMGGLLKLLPRTYISILLGSLSLMALPFFTGFYSKDLIQEVSLLPNSSTNSLAFILIYVAALFTSIYSIRLLFLTFINQPLFSKKYNNIIFENTGTLYLPLFILSILSVFFGYFAYELFIGFGSSLYLNSLIVHPNKLNSVEIEFLPFLFKLLTIIPILLLILIKPKKRSLILDKNKIFSTPLNIISNPLNIISNINIVKKIEIKKEKNNKINYYYSTYILTIYFTFFYLFLNLINVYNLDFIYNHHIIQFFINDWSFIYNYLPDIKNIGLYLYLGHLISFIVIILLLLILMIGILILIID